MSVIKEDFISIDLSTGSVYRSFASKCIGKGDKTADRFGVRCTRNGEPVSLTSCTVMGLFVRADGSTVIFNGNIIGNTAFVDLPEYCYYVDGNFQLTIKIETGGVSETVRIVDGTVIETAIGTILDPQGIVPDLESLTQVAERAEAAAEEISAFTVTELLIGDDDYRLIVNVEEES